MVVFLLVSATVAAGVAPTAPTAAEKPKKEARICRTIEITGSRMGVREICMPASEWEYQKQQAEQVLNGRRDLSDVEVARPPSPQ